MKVEEYDGKRERSIIIAMIISLPVLARLAPKWESKMCSSPECNLVGSWCVSHFEKYGEAPGRSIQNHFQVWADKRKRDESTVRLVEELLSNMSIEVEHSNSLNVDHIVDIANEHFHRLRLSRLADKIKANLEVGSLEKAQSDVEGFLPIQIGEDSSTFLLQDKSEVQSTFDMDGDEDLITFREGLGDFFRGQLARDCFVAFQAAEKIGKSMALLNMAWIAMLQRKRVAFFEVGDMSKRQIKRRFLARAARHPFRSTNLDGSWPCQVAYPLSIQKPGVGGDFAPVVHEFRTFNAPLNKEIAWDACMSIMKCRVKSDDPYLRLATRPNSSINVSGIRAELRTWEHRHGWVPDVIIIDYADILAPPSGSERMDPREQINILWKQMRALSTETHTLVVTATQSSRESYGRKIQDRRFVSEDKRKLAHTTGMVGINVTPEEKENGSYRYNWLTMREGEYSAARCVHIAGCLPIAAPCIRSVF